VIKGLSIEMKTPPAYRIAETYREVYKAHHYAVPEHVPDFIKPRNDRVLIQRIDEPESGLIITDKPKGIKGIVIAAGPGKWHEGEWWLIKGEWKWFDAYREPLDVKPGMTVYFNSRWNDLASDYQTKHIPLEFELNKLHLIQEADIYAIAS
jgi:co-chaperonin GroES (HSP10)